MFCPGKRYLTLQEVNDHPSTVSMSSHFSSLYILLSFFCLLIFPSSVLWNVLLLLPCLIPAFALPLHILLLFLSKLFFCPLLLTYSSGTALGPTASHGLAKRARQSFSQCFLCVSRLGSKSAFLTGSGCWTRSDLVQYTINMMHFTQNWLNILLFLPSFLDLNLRPLKFLVCDLNVQISHQLTGVSKGKMPSRPCDCWEFLIKKQRHAEHTEAVRVVMVEVVEKESLGRLLSS